MRQARTLHPKPTPSDGEVMLSSAAVARAGPATRLPGDIDGADGAGVLNIVERILVQHDQIGPLVCLERAQIRGVQERGRHFPWLR